jgi:hypothetical protein
VTHACWANILAFSHRPSANEVRARLMSILFKCAFIVLLLSFLVILSEFRSVEKNSRSIATPLTNL